MEKQDLVFMLFLLIGIPTAVQGQDIFDAVKKNDIAAAKALLENKPELINTKDADGRTPLHWATRGNHLEMMAYLIEKGADVNALDNFGYRVLTYADKPGASLLIDKGADVKKKNADGRTLWDRVTNIRRWFYSKEWIDFLVSRGVALPSDSDKVRLMLHSAAFYGHRQFVDLLLKKGTDISSKNNDGGTPLHSAAAGGLLDIVEMALGKGAEVNARDRYGLTALHLAALFGHPDVATALIARGAEINAASLEGKTPLHLAAEAKQEAMVKLLIAHRADQSPPKFPLLKGEYLGQKKPGMTPELFGLGIISSHRYEHTSLAFSPDGRELFWTSEAINASLDETTGGMMVMKRENDRWIAPQTAPFVTRKYWNANPAFSADGSKIFFTSNRSMPGDAESSSNYRIWVAEKKDGQWSPGRRLDQPLSNSFEEGPSVSKNGNLCYAAWRTDSKGERDIYRARFVNGRYLESENLGDSINTASYESFPYIAPDESYLLFESSRPGGFGNVDIYISFRRKDGTWTKAKNLGPTINKKGEDRFASVSPDGKYLFFASDRNGNMDIYWIDAKIIEELRPKDLK